MSGEPVGAAQELPEYAERVLELAELIPPGRVMTYGDVAEWLASEEPPADGGPGRRGAPGRPEGPESDVPDRPGEGGGRRGDGRRTGGPRQVGRVMALYGGGVPWWRVVRSDGVLLPGHELRALERYRAEGTPLRTAARATAGHLPRIDMARARWDGVPPGGGGARQGADDSTGDHI
ncbi:MGMT family protein [Streptomyces sp. URMC 123]|uniref:MGMT family protein n=1 Tax=Streptomyces sp. URMC 123 TaxID=3423403 RepID=UPI003F1B7042